MRNMKKTVAIAAAASLASFGLAAAPAAAAPGDVSLVANPGSKFAVFGGDTFDFDIATSPQLTFDGTSADSIFVKIDNKDEVAFDVDLPTNAVDAWTVNGNGQFDNDFHEEATAFTIPATASAVVFQLDDDNAPDVSIDITAGAYGDGDIEFDVQAWVDLDGDETTIEPTYASAVEEVIFYDPKSTPVVPRIERVETENELRLNDAGNILAATLEFGKPVNLEQVELDNFDFNVTVKDPDADTDNGEDFEEAVYGSTEDLVTFVVDPSFGDDRDDFSKLLFEFETGLDDGDHDSFINDSRVLSDGTTNDEAANEVDFSIAEGNSYSFTVNRLDDADESTRDITSPSFSVPTQATDATGMIVEAGEPESGLSQEDGTETDILARPGENALSFTAQLTDAAGDLDDANQLVAIAVRSVDFLAEDANIRLTGSVDTVENVDQSVLATAFTDSDGQVDFTVTTSEAVAGTQFEIATFYLDDTDMEAGTSYNVTYQSAEATVFEADSDVLGGETVNVGFSVEDQFGEPVSETSTDDLKVTLVAVDEDNLEVIGDVQADGTVSFDFENYVSLGESDILTATLVTGSLASPTTVEGPISLTLYNTAGASSITVPDEYSGVITYLDYVDGTETSANPAPEADSQTAQIRGTVVDANGSGIPGAPVTLSAADMMFQNDGSSTFHINEIDVVADAAGGFTVNGWTHTVDNEDGLDVTITSGGVSATTTVETYFPDDLDGPNLAMNVDMPENVVMDTTYAATVSLSDKWGNPVSTSSGGGEAGTAGVSIAGTGSVLVNNQEAGVTKNFGRDGTTTVFLRSVKDIAGPGALEVELLGGATYTAWDVEEAETVEVMVPTNETSTDVESTVWDETAFENALEFDVEVLETAPAATQKVNAGSFKGFVAVYARGYEGQRLSAKIGNDWVIVDPVVNNQTEDDLFRVTDFTGAGVDIQVRIYIDRVLIDTIPLTTK